RRHGLYALRGRIDRGQAAAGNRQVRLDRGIARAYRKQLVKRLSLARTRVIPHSPPRRIRAIELARSRPPARSQDELQSPQGPFQYSPEHRQYSARFILPNSASFWPFPNCNNRTTLNVQKYGFCCETPRIKRGLGNPIDEQQYVRRDIHRADGYHRFGLRQQQFGPGL